MAKIKAKILRQNQSSMMRYARALRRVTREMISDTITTLTEAAHARVAQNFAAEDANEGLGITGFLQMTMTGIKAKWSDIFSRFSERAAKQMVDQEIKTSSHNLKQSVLQTLAEKAQIEVPDMTGRLGEIYKAAVAENVSLIRSIPDQYLQQVERDVLRSVTTGQGLQDLLPQIRQYARQTERRAINLARDQTRKVYQSVNAARLKDMGIAEFEWIHSGGSNEPRPLHVSYNGRKFSFDDLPIIEEKTGERGIPGQAINCGCTMRPILTFAD